MSTRRYFVDIARNGYSRSDTSASVAEVSALGAVLTAMTSEMKTVPCLKSEHWYPGMDLVGSISIVVGPWQVKIEVREGTDRNSSSGPVEGGQDR
jgi:hypothetical protein